MKEPLTAGEWIVMNALWEKAPQTLSEVIKTIGNKAQWKYTTYASYLQILMRKGFVDAEMRGRDKFYYPLTDRGECIEMESASVVGKVNKSSMKTLVMNMIEKSDFTPDDHAELISLLETLMEKGERK